MGLSGPLIFPIQRQFLAPCFPRIFRIRRLMVIVSTISSAVNLLCNQLRDSNKYRAPYFPMYPYTIPYISLQHHIFFFAPHDFVGQLPTTPLLISSSIKITIFGRLNTIQSPCISCSPKKLVSRSAFPALDAGCSRTLRCQDKLRGSQWRVEWLLLNHL